jgi:hypothetical protein
MPEIEPTAEHVVEGAAAHVTGQAQLQRLAAQLFGNGEPYSRTRYRLTA